VNNRQELERECRLDVLIKKCHSMGGFLAIFSFFTAIFRLAIVLWLGLLLLRGGREGFLQNARVIEPFACVKMCGCLPGIVLWPFSCFFFFLLFLM